MTLAAILTFNAILLCAAASDVRCYRIPNVLPALLAIAGLVLAFPASLDDALSRAGSLAIVSLITGALWLRGLCGGGDLKLLMACAIWMPIGSLASFAIMLGAISALQGVGALTWRRFASEASWSAAARTRLPYGVSIAGAGLVWSVTSWLSGAI